MKPFDVNCDKPPMMCRLFHRVWWAQFGTKKQCTSCGACWDVRERPGQDKRAVPERRFNEGKDDETVLLGVPAILEGTDQFRINYAGQVIRVTLLERIGPMLKCRWSKDGHDRMLCVNKNTVFYQDADRLGRMGGSEAELVWESDNKQME